MFRSTSLFVVIENILHVYSEIFSDHRQAIVGGVLGFWGGVLAMGTVYISMVLVKRCLTSPGAGPESEY